METQSNKQRLHIYESGYRAGLRREDYSLVAEERRRYRKRDPDAWDEGYNAATGMPVYPKVIFAWNPSTVRGLRIRLQLTQEEFARRLHVSHNAVSRWESGRATPHRMSQRLLDALYEEAHHIPPSAA